MSPTPDTPVGERIGRRLDDFGRRHPRLMIGTVLVLACVATILLLAKSDGPVVLYQRF